MESTMVSTDGGATAVPSETLVEALTRCTGAYVACVEPDGALRWDNARYAGWFGMLVAGSDNAGVLRALLQSQPIMRDAIEGGHRRTFGGIWANTALYVDVMPIQDGCLIVCHPSVFEGSAGRVAEIPLESESITSNLTANEREVLELIGSGMKTREIAKIIHRSEKTIEARRSALGKKIGVETRGELVRVAVRAGLAKL